MPILSVKVSSQPTPEKSQAIVDLLMDLTQRILGKKPTVTAITLEFIAHEQWFIAGQSLQTQGKNSFYFDIKITDETNTKDEKAQYIREAFAGFERILDPLHEESYIYVQDVRAAAYGFGGKTQGWRYQR